MLTLWRPLLSSRRHTKSEYMGLSSMTIILPIVPPPSLPNQQSAVLVPIQPLQRIVYLYPQCLPYGWLHTVSPMAARFLSASTSFSDGVLIRPVLSCPWPSAALRTSFTSACVVLVSFFNVCRLLPKASRAIVDAAYIFLSDTLILYNKTIATIRPRILACTTKSFYNNWLELNLVVLQVYLYYIRHRDDALYVSWQHRVIFRCSSVIAPSNFGIITTSNCNPFAL